MSSLSPFLFSMIRSFGSMSASKSASKKREAPPPTIAQLHAASVTERWPASEAIRQQAKDRLETIKLARLQQEWQQAKQLGLAALRTLCNGWIAHRSDLISGASSRTLYTGAFGPSSDETPHAAAAIRTLQSAAHRAAVRAAEAQLQVMREATQKMVTAVERLQGHLSFLQDCWNQLHTVISGPESTTQQHASFDSVAAQTLQPEEAKNSPAQEAANKLAPTDVVIVTATASLTLQQAIDALSNLIRMYHIDLHTKSTLLDAVAKMLLNPSSSSAAAATSSSALLRSPAEEHAAEVQQSRGSLEPLTMYIATWMMEPDVSSETLLTTTHLFGS